MTAKSSISRVPARRHFSRRIRQTAIATSLLAIILMAVTVVSFTRANDLMRQPAKPLDTFSSNILPAFDLASFPSLDEQTLLHGWFFKPAAEPVSTIILVHDQGKNRLQFGLDSAEFYRFLLSRGFCVLAFDLRSSGQSDGEMSGYGYAEWADVLAAVRYVRKNAVTHDVLLFGFGTGAAASLIALDQLPPAGTVAAAAADDAAAQVVLKKYPENIQKLLFDQAYIQGLLLDTPCDTPDEYIRAACREEGWLGRNLLQYTVPYAIRLSTGFARRPNLTTILTRGQMPVFLTYSQQTLQVSQQSISTLVQERLRLHPDTTTVYPSSQPGYADGYLQDQTAYLAAVKSFLELFFN
jgi:pimeloyl-ACP methyl ester carboxylesterase